MYRFDKTQRLRKKAEYDWVFANARKLTDSEFIVLFRKNDLDYARLGLALSKKHIPRAHDRNRIKRIIRESFRRNRPAGFDLIFLAKKNLLSVENPVLFSRLDKIWDKLSAI